MKRPDDLSDVMYGQRGIFGAEGLGGSESALAQHEQVRHEPRREGMAYMFVCPGCGVPKEVVVEWPEFVALKFGLNPRAVFQGQYAVYVQGAPMGFQPNTQERAWAPTDECDTPGCEYHWGLRIGPDEPERMLRVARRGGLINSEGERQVTQICKNLVAQRSQGWSPQR